MIRAAVPEDFAAIDAFDPFAGDRTQEIADGRMLVLEHEHIGSVAGYVSWARQGFVGRDYITFLSVDDAYRRRGLATALLQAAIARNRAGRRRCSARAEQALRLWESLNVIY